MIITQDIARIAQALLKDTTGSLVEATWQSLTPLHLTPGQMVRGEVMANLANSRYLVRIANELLHMELPLNLQPGQAVELTYVTDEPRLLFALSKSANSATPVQISDTGRWLNTLAQGTGDAPAASPLPRPSLVIPAPPRDPAHLAEGLRNVLTRSGVFYESHLSQWVRGERPLADLLREPQGRLSPLAGRLPAEGSGTPPAPHGVQGAQASGPQPPPAAAPAPPAAAADGAPSMESSASPSSRPPVPGGPPAGQGTDAAADTASRRGEMPPDTPVAGDPKGGQATGAESRAPVPQTAVSPQNTPPASGRPAESPPPSPAPPQQTGAAPSPPDAGTVAAPPAPSRDGAAPAGAPPFRPAGEASAHQPAAAAPQQGHAPQPRETVAPGPAEDGRHSPAAMPDPRAAAPNQPQPPPRDGVPPPPPGKNPAPPPVPGPPDGGRRTAILGDIAPPDRGGAGRPAAPPPPAGVDPQTIPIIKEQLATLTTGVFTWFGQAWPGQEMEWQVEEREAEGGKGERGWQTEVAVELPTLGGIRATLRSGKEGIAVMLAAEDGRTAEILASGQGGLEERFGAAGLRLGGFTVRNGTQ
uniref:Flagellar hook-length control protein FliK n=1 Tax=Geobacter metallireducens TaxID=28232 RepID=A0A831TZL6_GEOME